jgi:hypothetical protein
MTLLELGTHEFPPVEVQGRGDIRRGFFEPLVACGLNVLK